MMEHRWDARIHVPVRVVVHTAGGTSLRSFTHNISHGGLFVDIHDPDGVASNGEVEMEKIVWVEFNEDRFAATLPALVIRRSNKAAALMFITHPPDLRPFLNQLNWWGDGGCGIGRK